MSQEWNRREFMKGVILQAGVLAVDLRGQAPRASRRLPLVAVRIPIAHAMTDDRFQELLDFFARHPGAVDELAFFTSQTHPPLPLAEMERRAQRLGKILPRVRQQGMQAGINILSTMGHHEENLPHSLDEPWQRVMDPWGKVCRGTYCPAHPELIDYARKIYTVMTQAGPDFIWIDDDVRLAGHLPITYTCFCDLCVQQFSDQVGTPFTRESLVRAFDAGPLEDRLRLRREWLEHNRRVIDNLFRNIEEVVHKIRPGLPLGFMTGDRFYEGYGFERWAKTLSGPGRTPVRWRPGGGFYTDDYPLGLVDKANDMGRQVSALPPQVEVIQSEIENFPYQPLRKSKHTVAIEAAAHMAAGTTGTAFNILSNAPLEEYVPLFDRISQYRPFYQHLQSALGRSVVRGIWPGWNQDIFSTVNPDGEWLAGGRVAFTEAYVLGEIGIPICYHPGGRAATALAGSSVYAFAPEELRRIFSGGVLMDAKAWLAMNRLGLASWTGVRELDGIDRDAIEVFTKHPLNARFAGWQRDCRQSFWPERVYRLQPQGDDVETLARLIDYGDHDLGPCTTAFTNEFGGRVVVLGYYPWAQIHSLEKSSQMKAICSWVSKDRQPAVAESFAKVVIWCREGVGGKQAVVVLNASLDPIEKLSLRVLAETTRFTHITPGKEQREILGERLTPSSGYARVVLSDLTPWSMHLLASERV